MNSVIYLFGSGMAFFVGAGLIFASIAIFCFIHRHWLRVLAGFATGLGCVLILLSATPLSYAFYIPAASVTALWIFIERSQRPRISTRKWLRRGVAIAWLIGIALEGPYHLTPSIPGRGQHLYIIGDSIAAGMGPSDNETWPRLLSRNHAFDVEDFSRMAATAASAMIQAERLPATSGLVLLEIGGNDLLGGTPAVEYEQDLERLLGRIQASDRIIVMFELPLPPLANEFGRIQRKLAARFNVILIPKRLFIAVLTREGNTIDGIHLTRQGHEHMARFVRELLGPRD